MCQISSRIIIEKIEGKTVLFDPDKLFFYDLNDTASFFFRELKKKKEIDDIVILAGQRYEVNNDIVKKDLLKFISMLKEKGILL